MKWFPWGVCRTQCQITTEFRGCPSKAGTSLRNSGVPPSKAGTSLRNSGGPPGKAGTRNQKKCFWGVSPQGPAQAKHQAGEMGTKTEKKAFKLLSILGGYQYIYIYIYELALNLRCERIAFVYTYTYKTSALLLNRMCLNITSPVLAARGRKRTRAVRVTRHMQNPNRFPNIWRSSLSIEGAARLVQQSIASTVGRRRGL